MGLTEAFAGDYLEHVNEVMRSAELPSLLDASKAALTAVGSRGGKVMLAGNGASASMASHYALDFTKQAKIPSVAFNDAALLTAYGNDYGYENWVARAVEHYGRPGDAAVLISTSGSSANIVNAAEVCRSGDITVITFTGFEASNPVRERGDVNFWAASRAYNVVESVHALWLGLLCDLIIGKREYSVSG